jgi:Glycosyltransferase 61
MRVLLDKLLARQAKLVSDLTQPVLDAPRPGPSRRPQGDPAVESAALTEVDAALRAGDVAQARLLLEPLEAEATFPRTLTLLARMSALDGDDELALARLLAAERLAPMERATWHLLADHMLRMGNAESELAYRRKLAWADDPATPAVQVALIKALVKASHAWGRSAKVEIRTTIERLKRTTTTQPEHLAEAAEAVYAGTPLLNDARELYREATPCPSTHVDVTAQWIPMAEWCDRHAIGVSRDTQSGLPGRRSQIAELPNVLVCGMLNWTPLLDNGTVVLAGFEKTSIPTHAQRQASPLLMSTASTAELRLPKKRKVESRRAILVGGSPDNFKHMVDYMGALAVAETFGIGEGLPLVVDSLLAPSQLSKLKHLGFGEDRLIRVDASTTVEFERLIVPTRLSSAGSWVDPGLPAWYRRRFAPDPSNVRAEKKLFLRSHQVGSVGFVNESEVVALLQKLGFESLDESQLTVSEWIAAFSSASCVVAPMGPQLADVLLCPQETKVVALCDPNPVSRSIERLRSLTAACGHSLSLVRCARGPDQRDRDDGGNGELFVDPAALLEVLE